MREWGDTDCHILNVSTHYLYSVVDPTRLLRVLSDSKEDRSTQANVDIGEKKKCKIADFLFPVASQGCPLKFYTK